MQVGDPFQEKLLLEATLEALKADVVVGIQDMGAAGITSSSFEMTSAAGTGMDLQLDRVPTRESGMNPYEIMLSESQERMLIVCKTGREDDLKAIFEKWDLNAQKIGAVTEEPRVRIHWHGEVVADLDPSHLAAGDGAPVYERESTRPAYLEETRAFDAATVPDVTPDTATDTLLDLLAAPNIA